MIKRIMQIDKLVKVVLRMKQTCLMRIESERIQEEKVQNTFL